MSLNRHRCVGVGVRVGDISDWLMWSSAIDHIYISVSFDFEGSFNYLVIHSEIQKDYILIQGMHFNLRLQLPFY
jgi:hypothetical protein